VGEAKIVMEVVPATGDDEMPAASGGEGRALSGGKTDDSMDEKASNDENLQTYNLVLLLLPLATLSRWRRRDIFRMAKPERLGWKPCRSWRKTKLSYTRNFFIVSLRMPPHPALVDILLKFQVQLHELTLNTFA
jgi:hypothetical protein